MNHTTHHDDCGCKSAKMQAEIDKLKEALLDMVCQHTAIYEGIELMYDSNFLSANEDALDLCVELGMIKKEQVIR